MQLKYRRSSHRCFSASLKYSSTPPHSYVLTPSIHPFPDTKSAHVTRGHLACVLGVGRLRLQKNRDSDYLAILSLFEVIDTHRIHNLTKSNRKRNRKSDYRFLFFRIVMANPNYQLLILSNRPTSTRHAAGRRPYGYLRNRIWALLTQIVEGGNRF